LFEDDFVVAFRGGVKRKNVKKKGKSVAAAPPPVESSASVVSPKKRQLFPETWLWDSVIR